MLVTTVARPLHRPGRARGLWEVDARRPPRRGARRGRHPGARRDPDRPDDPGDRRRPRQLRSRRHRRGPAHRRRSGPAPRANWCGRPSAAGRHVVSDRSVFSALAYQGYGRGLPLATVRAVNEWAIGGRWPDLALLLERLRRTQLARRMQSRELDRFEQEADRTSTSGCSTGSGPWPPPTPSAGSIIDADRPRDDTAARDPRRRARTARAMNGSGIGRGSSVSPQRSPLLESLDRLTGPRLPVRRSGRGRQAGRLPGLRCPPDLGRGEGGVDTTPTVATRRSPRARR